MRKAAAAAFAPLAVLLTALLVALLVHLAPELHEDSRTASEPTGVQSSSAPGGEGPGHLAEITNSIGMKLVHLRPGSFSMGSPSTEPGREGDEVQHRVVLTRGFWLAQTEVTVGQWRAAMGTQPRSYRGDELPMECVNWDDAVEFCRKLGSRFVERGRV